MTQWNKLVGTREGGPAQGAVLSKADSSLQEWVDEYRVEKKGQADLGALALVDVPEDDEPVLVCLLAAQPGARSDEGAPKRSQPPASSGSGRRVKRKQSVAPDSDVSFFSYSG